MVLRGRAHSVRAPLTGEALAILAALESPTTENILVVDEICRRWLPDPVAKAILKRPDGQRLRVLHDLIMQGVPEKAEQEPASRDLDEPVYRSRDEWEDIVADYMHAFGLSARQVLEEPWAAFLLMSSKISQVLARDQVRLLYVRGLPYIKNYRERQKAYDDLVERGKLPVLDEVAERERKLRKQREWLESLDAGFRLIRNNPRA